MKTILCFVTLLVAIMAGSPVFAETDLERLVKLFEKNGVTPDGVISDGIREAKAGCVCNEGSLIYRAGYLVHLMSGTQLTINCYVPVLDGTGTATFVFLCASSYHVIAR